MKNIWKKLRDCWLDFWEDDELDMDKKHLSQHDKRSLLYGGFMIGVATFGLFLNRYYSREYMDEPSKPERYGRIFRNGCYLHGNSH